jgi:hypothetical protein
MAHGPHQSISTDKPRDRFALQLFDQLWERYRGRVSYVRKYEEVVRSAGATFVNDHIAFRTFAVQQPLAGISWLSRIFEALGYRAAGVYNFETKHLNATHYQHPHPEFPKLFISELKTWELSVVAQRCIQSFTNRHRQPIAAETLSALNALNDEPTSDVDSLIEEVLSYFHQLPWELPAKEDVELLNGESQYGAWVAVHGYDVNHFTSLVNSHGVAELSDIDKTIAALSAAGIPMKTEVEGAVGSKLRQSATEAVVIDVDVTIDGQAAKMPWAYAYFELAERGEVFDAAGNSVRFEGFLGPQATQLFEMTKLQ